MELEFELIYANDSFDLPRWALETGLWDGRLVTWEEAPQFTLEVKEKIAQLLFSKDLSMIEFHQMTARLAQLGSYPSEHVAIVKEIENLGLSSNGVILQIKSAKSLKNFWKKHKVAIIVGAIVVTAIIVAIVITVSSAGTASAAAAAGCAALDSLLDEQKAHKPSPAPIAQQLSIEKPIEISQSPPLPSSPSLADKAKGLSSYLAHEVFDAAASIGSEATNLMKVVQDIGSRILPEDQNPPTDDRFFKNPVEYYEQFVAKGHETIDCFFSTDQASNYTQEAKAKDPLKQFTIGVLPPPSSLATGINTSKIKQLIASNQHIPAIAKELGLSTREIAHLQKAGTLESTVTSTFETIVSDKELLASCERFKKAEAFLKPYVKEYISETQAKALIQQTGIATFHRPKGIPDNFKIKLSKSGAGIEYVHPTNSHIRVRIMPGKPHSLNPSQRAPYVIHKKHGKTLDKLGNIVDASSPEAHIPLNEFSYQR